MVRAVSHYRAAVVQWAVRRALAVCLASAVCCASAVGGAATASAQFDDEERRLENPVQSAKDGLAEGGFNWYDASEDALKPLQAPPVVKNRPPPAARNPNLTAPSMPNFEILLWTMAAVAAGVIVYLLIVAYLKRETREAKEGDLGEEEVSPVDRLDALPMPVSRDVGDLLSAARAAYAAGRFRDAIIYFYSHQLMCLDKRQIIQLSKGKTNREYVREVARARQRELQALLEQTVSKFEAVFFGDHPITREEMDAVFARWPDFDRAMQGAAL